MSYFQKLLAIFFIFLALRLLLIFTFPPFVDELNYVLWGSSMLKDPSLLFSSIDIWHKQPLPFWVFGLGAFITPDGLTGARIISIIISIPSFFAIFKLIELFKNKKAALIGILIYSLCPLFIFFNSLALFDSILFYIGIIILWLLFKIEKKPSWMDLSFLGLALGLAFWVKVTSIFLIIFSILGLAFVLYNQKSKTSKILSILYVLILFSIISLPLILIKNFYLIFLETQTFGYSFEEILQFPILVWLKNLAFVVLSLSIYLTPFLFACLFFLKRDLKESRILFLIIAFFLLILGIILASQVIRTRYFLLSVAPLLPLLTLGAYNFIYSSKKYIYQKAIFLYATISIGAFILIFYPVAFFSFFPKNSLLSSERDYVFGWPAGYGLKDLNLFLDETSKQNGFVLIMPASPTSVTSYLSLNASKNSRITLMGAFIESKESLNELKDISLKYPTLFTSSSVLIPEILKPYLKPVKIIQKPGKEDYLGVYAINFPAEKKE